MHSPTSTIVGFGSRPRTAIPGLDVLSTPQAIRHQVWIELARATQDRHHAWRTPVLATIDPDGSPRARSVVLRRAQASAQSLDFYTDGRSPKVRELQHQPRAQCVFWSARLGWQLRIQVVCSVFLLGPEVDRVWSQIKPSKAAGDYLSPAAPGALQNNQATQINAQQATEPTGPDHHLAIVRAQVCQMDWLELSRNGHRRAQFTPTSWDWLTP